jgi:signal transduction histidine kinase
LAVVKTVTEAHGGDLTLNAEPEGGTRVDIHLPRMAPLDAAAPSPGTAQEVA